MDELIKQAIMKKLLGRSLTRPTGKPIINYDPAKKFINRGPLQGDVERVALEQGMSPRAARFARIASIAEGPITNLAMPLASPMRAVRGASTQFTKSMATAAPGTPMKKRIMSSLLDSAEPVAMEATGLGMAGSGVIGTALGARAARWRQKFIKQYGHPPQGNQLARFVQISKGKIKPRVKKH